MYAILSYLSLKELIIWRPSIWLCMNSKIGYVNLFYSLLYFCHGHLARTIQLMIALITPKRHGKSETPSAYGIDTVDTEVTDNTELVVNTERKRNT